MIGNSSRLTQFQSCREKGYNWDELQLTSFRDPDPLMVGEAYHFGSEVLSKTGDVEGAVAAAESKFRERLKGQIILQEELPDIERQIEFVKHATRQWAIHYASAEFRVLWPEVSGMVALPNTEHHCFFCHRLLYPEVPFKSCPAQEGYTIDEIGRTDPHEYKCWQPHYFKFRTDGVIEFAHKIWLLEQKTTSSTTRNNFWTKFNMDFQVGCYLYGVWKKTGQMPSGVFVNAIIKHSVKDGGGRSGYKMKLDPTNVDFERDYFLYTEKMLLSFEHDLICQMNEYEEAFANPPLKIFRNTKSCFDWNRQCYYWDRCNNKYSGNEYQIEGEFRKRSMDYVQLSYYELLGLPIPEENTCAQTAVSHSSAADSTPV